MFHKHIVYRYCATIKICGTNTKKCSTKTNSSTLINIVAQYIDVAPIIKFVAHTTTVAHNSENVAQNKRVAQFKIL
ncbi:MAG: hypothetical protein IJI98_04420 [Methanosphaera sp.]|nr:hypothetical protein [Methanosphaera sp.]